MNEEKDFRIRFDLIVKHDIRSTINWREHPAIIKMVSILEHKSIDELFVEVIQNKPYVKSDMKVFESWLEIAKTTDSFEIRDKNRKLMRDFLFKNAGFGAGNDPNQFYYIYSHMYHGVNLNQTIQIEPDHELFPILFSFRLSKTKYPIEFLNFHYTETYKKNTNNFRLLLTQLDSNLISNRVEFLNEWREQNLRKRNGAANKGRRTKDFDVENNADVVKLLKNFCKNNASINKKIAAKTFIEAYKENYNIKITGAAIARFFFKNGILPGEKVTTLKDQLKPKDLKNIQGNSNLYSQLLKLI